MSEVQGGGLTFFEIKVMGAKGMCESQTLDIVVLSTRVALGAVVLGMRPSAWVVLRAFSDGDVDYVVA